MLQLRNNSESGIVGAYERYADQLTSKRKQRGNSEVSAQSYLSSISEIQCDPVILREMIDMEDENNTGVNEALLSSKSRCIILMLFLSTVSLAAVTALSLTGKINTVTSLDMIKKNIDSVGGYISFDGTLCKMPKDFPSPSYSIYARNSDVLEQDPVPIVFEISDNNSLNVPSTLSTCLGYKQISNEKDISSVQKGEFYYTNSLCDFARTHYTKEEEKKLKVYLIINDPILSTTFQYQKKTNPESDDYDMNLLGTSFKEYIESSFYQDNLLTRSIVCKSKDEALTKSDFIYARDFLKTRCVVQTYYGFIKGSEKFAEVFKDKISSVSSSQSDKCVETKGNSLVDLDAARDLIEKNFDLLSTVNHFDMMLYFDTLNSNTLGRTQ